MSPSFSPVRRSKSLHEQTYEALRAFILSGELAPGERLVETHLAEKLNVSRTPIREALRQLQRETLLLADRHGGLRVPTLSVDDAVQLYDCRIALEQLAVKEACAHATADEIQEIERWVVQAEALDSNLLTSSNSVQMLEVDYCFHRAIANSTHNRWLVLMLDQLFNQMVLMRTQTTRHNPQVLDIRGEHRPIFEAIARRDADAAAQAICAHLTASKQRVTQAVQALQRITARGNFMAQTSTHRVFICGSALRGQPDHGNLQSATFLRETKTQPLYRLHAAKDGWHPAIYQVESGGISIPGEVYELTPEQYEYLVSTEPPDMYPADVVLDDGEIVTAILYPRDLVEKYNWPDVSGYGGWVAYKTASAQQVSSTH